MQLTFGKYVIASFLCALSWGCNLHKSVEPVGGNTNNVNNLNNTNNTNNASNNTNNVSDMGQYGDVEFTTNESFEDPSPRVTEDLIALYTFQQGSGVLIPDRSGFEDPSDLRIVTDINWLEDRNGIEVVSGGAAQTPTGPAKIYDAFLDRNAFTIEVWAKTTSATLSGPARLVTFSLDSGVRNYTLGVDYSTMAIRHRGSHTSDSGNQDNGRPYVYVRDVVDLVTRHWVYTFDGFESKLYRDGELVFREPRVSGIQNWDRSLPMAIGNEVSLDRPWEGEIYLFAIYQSALEPDEITRNFAAGDEITID